MIYSEELHDKQSFEPSTGIRIQPADRPELSIFQAFTFFKRSQRAGFSYFVYFTRKMKEKGNGVSCPWDDKLALLRFDARQRLSQIWYEL